MDINEFLARGKRIKNRSMTSSLDVHSKIRKYLPTEAMIHSSGKGYYRIINMNGHYLANSRGEIPLHRYLCWQKCSMPASSFCYHCGFLMPWKTALQPANIYVVNVDHLDGNVENNDPYNLVPSCLWCNANRSWAEDYREFWQLMRELFSTVPPQYRPDIRPFLTLQNLQPKP